MHQSVTRPAFPGKYLANMRGGLYRSRTPAMTTPPDNPTSPPERVGFRPAEPPLGPSDAEEILEEWRSAGQLAQRLRDPLWQPAHRFLPRPSKWASESAVVTAPASAKSSPPPRKRLGARLYELAAAFYQGVIRPVGRAASRRAFGVVYHSGAEVVATANVDTARRLRALMAVEMSLPKDADYGIVIAPACVVLELILGELLRPIEQSRSDTLAWVLEQAGRARQAELLRKWAAGRLPMTMGLQVTLLAALEKAAVSTSVRFECVHGLRTTRRYLDLVRSGTLAAILERVRTEYRNPACHGTRTFGRVEYAAFVQLLLTRDRFRSWYRRGPVELDVGFLDMHLLEWCRVCAAEEAKGTA